MTTKIEDLRAEMKTLRGDASESVDVEATLLALRKIAKIFAPVVQDSTFLDLLRGASPPGISDLIGDCDPTLFVYRFGPDEIVWILPVRLEFSLSADVLIAIRSGRGHFGTRSDVEVNVTWASGGGSVSEALAQASLHLDLTQKAAQAEMILRSLRSTLDRTSNPGEVFERLNTLSRVAHQILRENAAQRDARTK